MGISPCLGEPLEMIVETEQFQAITELEGRIPEFTSHYPLERIQARLKDRPSLALLVLHQGEPVGYKVGYEETPQRFYSWIGAVLPEHRGRGWARQLLHYQENWCRAQGYREITVWSENRYRSMLIFLLRENYDIFAVSGEGKILFRKLL